MKTNPGLLTVTLACTIIAGLSAQPFSFPYPSKSRAILQKLEIQGDGNLQVHPGIHFWTPAVARHILIQLYATRKTGSPDADLIYLEREVREWEYLFPGNANPPFLSGETKSFEPFLPWSPLCPVSTTRFLYQKGVVAVELQPVVEGSLRQEFNTQQLLFFNGKGLNLRGVLGPRIFFSSSFRETQALFPSYRRQWIEQNRAIPGNGYHKPFRSTLFNTTEALDFMNARGKVGISLSDQLTLEFGHDRHFIGNGIRSLILSDIATNYLFLRINAHLGRFNYQLLWGELLHGSHRDYPGDLLIPKKYLATHHLSINITPNLNIGLFEAVVLKRDGFFDFQYLNPIILYRVVEQMTGSPDNVLVGLDFRLNMNRTFQLYGQLILDEFKLRELLLERTGWWANKYGVQAGVRYPDIGGIRKLDFQVEYNRVRPYTYSHRDSSLGYAHYNQPLAHPYGANFQEWTGMLEYAITIKWKISARGVFLQCGTDQPGDNWGNNILLSNQKRMQEFGNFMLQGRRENIALFGLHASYSPIHRLFLDLELAYRTSRFPATGSHEKTLIIGGGFQLNGFNRAPDW